ncbi:MAG: hypothetical protein NTV40_00790 [Solirubrobacterales bacterium]|nr:hypothetical protein [Solirubrobacterales bacterium]
MKSSVSLSLTAAAATITIAAGLSLAAAPAQANGCITNTAGVSDGTAAHPFLIATVGNLQCMRDNAEYLAADQYFKQTADIDLSAQPTWTTTIGTAATPFAGSYDGGGKKIIGLNVMHAEANNSGLFGVTSGATLANLYLEDAIASLTTGNNTNWWSVGALVGLADNETQISNVHSSGIITGQVAGGLVGTLNGGSDISSSSSAAVIVGYLWCAGGLVGSVEGGGTLSSEISDSSATGAVSGHIFIGGLIGGIWSQAAPVTVTRSFASGNVTVTALGEGYAGGLVGLLDHQPNSGTAISESFATGDVTYSDPRPDRTDTPIGGLVGGSNVSGSVAEAGNSITDSYSTGTLTGVGPAGGVVGKNYAGNLTISNTYSRSAVHGEASAVGGILGAFDPNAPTIMASFWNPTDADNTHANSYGTQATQAEMTTAAFYSNANWDISAAMPTTQKWVSCAANNDGYPFLQWYGTLQGWTCDAANQEGPTPVYLPDTPTKRPKSKPAKPAVTRSSSAKAKTVTAVITPVTGVTYRLTATSGRVTKTGSCKNVTIKQGKKRVARRSCTIKLAKGKWLVSVTPKKGSVSGTVNRKSYSFK